MRHEEVDPAKMDLAKAPWVNRREGNQLCGYYISFDPTGRREIDEILKAVASAAKMYHSTEWWGDPLDGGPSCLDWIQAAALAAARAMEDDA